MKKLLLILLFLFSSIYCYSVQKFTGDVLITSGNFLPSGNLTTTRNFYNLGATNNYWNNAYISSVNVVQVTANSLSVTTINLSQKIISTGGATLQIKNGADIVASVGNYGNNGVNIDVYSGGAYAGRYYFNNTAANFFTLGTGTVYSNSGSLTNSNPSDINLKYNVQAITNGELEKILKLQPKSWNWKNNGKYGEGVIAQELELIYPNMVVTDNVTKKKGIYSERLIYHLIKAFQEQNKITEGLKARIEILERQ